MQVTISESRFFSSELLPIDGCADLGAVFIGDGDMVVSIRDNGGDEAEICRHGGDGLDESEGDYFVSGEAAGGGNGEVAEEVFPGNVHAVAEMGADFLDADS